MRLDVPKAPLREPADVSAWLLTLKKVLRLPEGEAAAILDELEDHLRQRVRDLELSGLGDAEAVRLALNELGDAAVLARRFRSANTYKRRRLAMNTLVLGVAFGAAALSVFSVAKGPQQGAAPKQEQKLSAAANAYIDLAGDQPGARLSFTETQEQPLEQVLAAVSKALDVPLHVRWGRLEQFGVQPDLSVVVVGRDLGIAEVFRRINEAESMEMFELDYRVDHGVLEVADREFFDRRERVLASYDIARLLERATSPDHRTQLVESLTGTVTAFVSPDDWRDNGGELGVLSVVDTTLFVEAPPRMHRQVEWILDQLGAGEVERVKADVPLLGDVPVLGELKGAAVEPAPTHGPQSSKSYLFQSESPGELRWVDEVWAAGRIAGPLEFRTENGKLTVTGPDRDVAELARLVGFVAPPAISFQLQGTEREALEAYVRQLRADLAARKQALGIPLSEPEQQLRTAAATEPVEPLAAGDPERAKIERSLSQLEQTIRGLEQLLNPPGC